MRIGYSLALLAVAALTSAARRTYISRSLMIVTVPIVAASGIFVLGSCARTELPYQPTSTIGPMGEEVVVRGLVVENRLGCLADASCSLFLRVNGDEIKVVYDWGGEVPRCTNQARDQGFDVRQGDEVEVFGKSISEDMISTCESPDYYIRKLG